MHDWPFSTKQGGNKEGEEELGRKSGVALGNQETCEDLNRDLGISSRHLCAKMYGVVFIAAAGESPGDTDPLRHP